MQIKSLIPCPDNFQASWWAGSATWSWGPWTAWDGGIKTWPTSHDAQLFLFSWKCGTKHGNNTNLCKSQAAALSTWCISNSPLCPSWLEGPVWKYTKLLFTQIRTGYLKLHGRRLKQPGLEINKVWNVNKTRLLIYFSSKRWQWYITG